MKNKWILLAEDDRNDADLTLRGLTFDQLASDVQVVVVHDGSEALDCLFRRNRYRSRQNEDPAFVLLDLKMPRVDGKEVLRQIKSHPQLKLVPVIVFTSSREEIDLAQCYALGANAYVVKPLNLDEFFTTIMRLRDFWIIINEPPPRFNVTLMDYSTATVNRRRSGVAAR